MGRIFYIKANSEQGTMDAVASKGELFTAPNMDTLPGAEDE